jgi:hypothetical protein
LPSIGEKPEVAAWGNGNEDESEDEDDEAQEF